MNNFQIITEECMNHVIVGVFLNDLSGLQSCFNVFFLGPISLISAGGDGHLGKLKKGKCYGN